MKTEVADLVPRESEVAQQESDDLVFPKSEIETTVQNRTQKCRLSLRNQSNKTTHTDSETAVNSETSIKSVDSKHSSPSQKEKNSKKTSKFMHVFKISSKIHVYVCT